MHISLSSSLDGFSLKICHERPCIVSVLCLYFMFDLCCHIWSLKKLYWAMMPSSPESLSCRLTQIQVCWTAAVHIDPPSAQRTLWAWCGSESIRSTCCRFLLGLTVPVDFCQWQQWRIVALKSVFRMRDSLKRKLNIIEGHFNYSLKSLQLKKYEQDLIRPSGVRQLKSAQQSKMVPCIMAPLCQSRRHDWRVRNLLRALSVKKKSVNLMCLVYKHLLTLLTSFWIFYNGSVGVSFIFIYFYLTRQ